MKHSIVATVNKIEIEWRKGDEKSDTSENVSANVSLR